MFGFKRVVIAQYQRGLEFRDGRLVAILVPGVYWKSGRSSIVTEDIAVPEARFANAEAYVRENPSLVEGFLELVAIGADEVGLVYKDGRLAALLAPGARQVYWKGLVAVEVKRVDLGLGYAVPEPVLRVLATPVAGTAPALVREVQAAVVSREVPVASVGLLTVNGRIERVLEPGVYGYWKFGRNVAIELVDLRVQAIEVSGQEILTKDKVSLRANLSASYRIVDPVRVRSRLGDFKDALYRELQFGLRQAIGTRLLDTLLGNKGELDAAVFEVASEKLADYGIELVGAGVKDLILPGEMKEILNQVVQAEKAAQANVIRRREETAATRSLLNTAKLMEDSPVLLRLKELETLEKVTDKIDKLTVFGGLDGVLKDLVKISA